MAGGKFSDAVKTLVLDRAKNRCELCGTRSEASHFHHRQARQMGGSSNPHVGGPDNALLLHPSCHERIERNRATSYLMGWLVTKQDDPATTPVRLWDGWFLLDREGGMLAVDPSGLPRGSDPDGPSALDGAASS